MLEIAIQGDGEVVIALVDRKGNLLMRKRLVISGPEGINAKTRVPLELETRSGRTGVIPILLRKNEARQKVTFDEREPSAYAEERCRKLKAAPAMIQKAIEADRAQGPSPRAWTLELGRKPARKR